MPEPLTESNSILLIPTLTQDCVVVLVEPRIPQNAGNIARLCACTGAKLAMVGSLGFQLHDKFLQRAGMDYMDKVPIDHYPDFESLLAAYPEHQPLYLTTKAKQSHFEVAYPAKCLLVFGSESHGLPLAWIEANLDDCIRIPMLPSVRSLNLANTVSIVLYELIRQQLNPGSTVTSKAMSLQSCEG